MAFYESTFIIRQDVSSADVDKITEDFVKIITDHGGNLVKNEYWGLRTLAYEISKNKKGHYVMLGIEASAEAIRELERKMKLNENVIRFLTINVEEVSKEPSPILKGKSLDNEVIVDVTAAR
ncbi:MAG: ribosomal protein [Rickettsiaceae bacterium]|jgi:small subunit ribosomal protein S6|nr:ribosomal protein [Rickettsiaceae bacterium]